MLRSKMKKSLATILSLAAVVSCFTIVAFASSWSYAITVYTDQDGDWKAMDASNGQRIEYTGINANCPVSGATATLELYESSFPANTWKPSNQTISMGTGRRAWWGDCPANTYSIHAIANNNSSGGVRNAITLNGTFRNF